MTTVTITTSPSPAVGIPTACGAPARAGPKRRRTPGDAAAQVERRIGDSTTPACTSALRIAAPNLSPSMSSDSVSTNAGPATRPPSASTRSRSDLATPMRCPALRQVAAITTEVPSNAAAWEDVGEHLEQSRCRSHGAPASPGRRPGPRSPRRPQRSTGDRRHDATGRRRGASRGAPSWRPTPPRVSPPAPSIARTRGWKHPTTTIVRPSELVAGPSAKPDVSLLCVGAHRAASAMATGTGSARGTGSGSWPLLDIAAWNTSVRSTPAVA